MSPFMIGGSPLRPASGATGGKKPERKDAPEKAAAPPRGSFDTANVNPNRLAVMPRMSTISGQSAQHLRGEAVESLLRESAAELDDYFTKAYGFED